MADALSYPATRLRARCLDHHREVEGFVDQAVLELEDIFRFGRSSLVLEKCRAEARKVLLAGGCTLTCFFTTETAEVMAPVPGAGASDG